MSKLKNYGASLEEHPIDTARLRAVLARRAPQLPRLRRGGGVGLPGALEAGARVTVGAPQMVPAIESADVSRLRRGASPATSTAPGSLSRPRRPR